MCGDARLKLLLLLPLQAVQPLLNVRRDGLDFCAQLLLDAIPAQERKGAGEGEERGGTTTCQPPLLDTEL